MKAKDRFLIALLLSLGLIISLPSCKKEATAPEPETPQEEVNPNKPNANHLILNQKVTGDSAKGSSVYKIIDAGDGGFFFTGVMNSHYVIGRLDQFGSVIWNRRTGYWARDIYGIPNNSGQISNALVAVGGFDANNDGEVDEGKIIICNGTDGNLINEFTLPLAGRDVWLNTLALHSNNPDSCQFVGFGGSRIDGTYYPWVIRFAITSNGMIMKGRDTLFSTFPWVIFSTAKKNDELSSPSYIVQSQGYLNDSIETNIIVFGLSDSLDVMWNQNIIHRSGFKTESYTGRGIAIAGENLIIVGDTDLEKEKNPPDGYWDAGLVASLTKQGQVNWIKAVHITEYSESYVDCFIDGNSLWLVGDCSSFMKTQSKRTFAYGLLTKIDIATGNVLSNMSFGNESYNAGFNSMIVRNNRAYCIGYTSYKVSGEGYQSWFAEVDVSNPPPPSLQVTHPGANRTSVDNDAIRTEIRPGKHR